MRPILPLLQRKRCPPLPLAEHLRKIPLPLLGKRIYTDLTSTGLWRTVPSWNKVFRILSPELAGSIISTVLISIGLLFTDWRMALAALWFYRLVAFAIVGFSAKIQENLNQKAMDVKMACADGIQECIETVRDLESEQLRSRYI